MKLKLIVLLFFFLVLTCPSFSQNAYKLNRSDACKLLQKLQTGNNLKFKECHDLVKDLLLADNTMDLSHISAIDDLLSSQLLLRDRIQSSYTWRVDYLYQSRLSSLEKDKKWLARRIRILDGELYESRRRRRNQCKIAIIGGGAGLITISVLATLLATR